MNGWKALDADACDRRAVWLFLPSAERAVKPDGMVTDVKHLVVVGRWDGHWVNQAGDPVYPSLWHDADVTGEAPQPPELA